MTNRFYLISTRHAGIPSALVEALSRRSAMTAYAEQFHTAKVANARDVASAFQSDLLIISAPDVNPTDEKNEQT